VAATMQAARKTRPRTFVEEQGFCVTMRAPILGSNKTTAAGGTR
jgi:hypothetical protein